MSRLSGNNYPGNQHGVEKRAGVNMSRFPVKVSRDQRRNSKYREELKHHDKEQRRIRYGKRSSGKKRCILESLEYNISGNQKENINQHFLPGF